MKVVHRRVERETFNKNQDVGPGNCSRPLCRNIKTGSPREWLLKRPSWRRVYCNERVRRSRRKVKEQRERERERGSTRLSITRGRSGTMEFQPRSWRSNFEAVFAGAVKFKQAAGLFYVGLLTLFAVNSALFHRKWALREYHAHRYS